MITQHTTKDGKPKIVENCTYPLTGKGVVNRIYTNLAILDVAETGLVVKELAPGIDFEYAQEKTGATLRMP